MTKQQDQVPARVCVYQRADRYTVEVSSELGQWELDLTETLQAVAQHEVQLQRQQLEALELTLLGALERAEAVEVEAKVLRAKLAQGKVLVQRLVRRKED